MPPEHEELAARYKVVINDEEQYSLWPTDRVNPPGWGDAGKEGTKAECLSFIEEKWTDMRPRSLLLQMAAMEKKVP